VNSHTLGDVMGVLVKLVKAVFVGEALRLEQQFVLPVVDLFLRTELARFSLVTFLSVADDSRLFLRE